MARASATRSLLEAHFRKAKIGDRNFASLIQTGKTETASIVRKLARGKLDIKGFGDAMAEYLEDAHTAAAVLGRHLAGDLAPAEADDRTIAEMVVDEEAEFLQGFMDDLTAKDGRYFGEAGVMRQDQVHRRAMMYLGRLRATANESFVLSDLDAEYARELLTEEHCDDCIVLAENSPYTGRELLDLGPIAWPGSGLTICKFNCGCVLIRLSDGQFGFSRSYDLAA